MNINIIFWSGTGNTEAMANYIKEGAEGAGGTVTVKHVAKASIEDIECDVLCLGCPSMGAEVLEEDEFEPYIASIEGSVKDKKLALFGSYGWGDGEWMRDFHKRMEKAGAYMVCDSLTVCEEPAGDECRYFGKALVR